MLKTLHIPPFLLDTWIQINHNKIMIHNPNQIMIHHSNQIWYFNLTRLWYTIPTTIWYFDLTKLWYIISTRIWYFSLTRLWFIILIRLWYLTPNYLKSIFQMNFIMRMLVTASIYQNSLIHYKIILNHNT